MRAVVEQQRLLAAGRAELAPLQRVPDRDVERGLARGDRRAADADAALDQRPEHHEEALGRVLDRARVRAVALDGRVAVEQRVAGDADLVEGDPAVVDAVEPELRPAVLDRHARHQLAAGVAQRDEQGVDAARLAAADELREHDRQPAVAGGVADVVLARARRRRVDDELLGGRVVGRGRLERLHVRAVVALAHREAAGELEPRDRGEVALVVAHRAEVQHGAAEQAELDAALHQQARSPKASVSKRGDRAAARRPGRRTRPGSRSRSAPLSPAPPPSPVTCARCSSRGRSVTGALPGSDSHSRTIVADLGLGPVEERAEVVGGGSCSSLRGSAGRAAPPGCR